MHGQQKNKTGALYLAKTLNLASVRFMAGGLLKPDYLFNALVGSIVCFGVGLALVYFNT